MLEATLELVGLTPRDLPSVNAGLNTLCTILLVTGYALIRQGKVKSHMATMVAAMCVSALFLASYLYFHFVVKDGTPTRFTAEGWPRIVYFAILISHTILAIAVAVLAPVTLLLGFGAPGNSHKRLARWTLPIWLYVSVTGVIVYFMLYHWFPPVVY